MSTQRTLVMLEPPIRNLIKNMAKKERVSISSLCRDLIRQALEIFEDRYFDKLSSDRERKFNWEHSLTHEEVWNKKSK